MLSIFRQSKYKDYKLFLWLIPAINAVNYYLTYTHFHPLWRLFVTYTIDTLLGYIAWLIGRSIIIWLDGKVSYAINPIRRISIQLILTLAAGMGSIILLTELINAIATSKPVPSQSGFATPGRVDLLQKNR
jgi:hypothetical protein